MIIDLPATTVQDVARKLIGVREDVGAMALSRVLTLIIVTDEQQAERSLAVAGDATRQHPSRIVCLVTGNRRAADRIDAQIRVGGAAGASEVVVLRLYGELTRHGESVVLPLLLADSPIVAWWPFEGPKNAATDPIGALASRRITDAEYSANPTKTIQDRARTHVAGDTDLTWTRSTKWRGLLAAALDQPPYEQVDSVVVTGGLDSATTDLLGAWLGTYLDAPVTRARTPAGAGLISVRLERASGPVDLVRPDGTIATLEQVGQPVRRLALPRRTDAECLADELARLDADEVYSRTLRDGLGRLSPRRRVPAAKAAEQGQAPSVDESRAAAQSMSRQRPGLSSVSMKRAETPSNHADADAVRQRVEAKLAELRGDDPS